MGDSDEENSIQLGLQLAGLHLSVAYSTRPRSGQQSSAVSGGSSPPPEASAPRSTPSSQVEPAEPRLSESGSAPSAVARGLRARATAATGERAATPPPVGGPRWPERLAAAREAGRAARQRIIGSRGADAWRRHPAARGCGSNQFYCVVGGEGVDRPTYTCSLLELNTFLAGRKTIAYHGWETWKEVLAYCEGACSETPILWTASTRN